MARLAYLALKVSTETWGSVGFPKGTWRLAAVCVSIEDSKGVPSLHAGILDHDGELKVGGLHVAEEQRSCSEIDNALGLESIDHLMVRTRNPESTLQTLSRSFGVSISSDENGESSVWLDSVRIDMVHAPELSVPAELWGVAFRVSDIDPVFAHLGGEVIGAPKAARQRGQRVAVFRGGAELGVPTALVDLRG